LLAKDKLDATNSLAGTDRTKEGEIAYYVGQLKKLTWQKQQRT
jgi:hypothetical protein